MAKDMSGNFYVEYPTRKMMDATRIMQLAVIWGKTHRDYRGKIDGKKAILILRDGGTCLVPLEDLTDTEISTRMPKNVIIEKA